MRRLLLRNSRIYYFVGDLTATTDDLVAVLSDFFALLVPKDVLAPLFEPDQDGRRFSEVAETSHVTRELPRALLKAIAAAGGAEWPYLQPVYMTARSWVDAQIISGPEPDDVKFVPVRRLAELILTAPMGVDLDVLPPLMETVLKAYGASTTVDATRGQVPVWDLGNGWHYVADVQTPRWRYGVESNG